ncbi:hypothetical protein Pla175_41150 [Pirellulimonas nuda]|uniref:NfeD-like C-terminal domain-containing protein n=1 Tax=Pirellulimonas nuda TaxID=2528009 RepID=A0A518DGV3_9BACT|nr:hypothetical protein [Pirellulimonas nuda]QDU90705.1 hypothetical protein Pla175_41150 [Pirellulimonas nuda]
MLDQLFLFAALLGGGVLVVQLAMMLLGLGGDGFDFDVDVDADLPDGDSGHSGVWFWEVLSIRTLSAFGAAFGMVGMACRSYGQSPLAAGTYASLAGLAAMYGVYWLFKQIYRLESAGNEDIQNALDLPAKVYVPIPGEHRGKGKVTLTMQNRTVEYQAVTDESHDLKTGEQVTVTSVVSPDTLCVRKL